MADKNKLPVYGMAYYNPLGQYRWCSNDSDVRNAINDGYTSKKYVPSKWPTTVYNQKTGQVKTVGKLDRTDEQNEAEITALGPEWGREHVAAPEPAAATAQAVAPDNRLLGELLAELRLLGSRIDDLETAVSDIAGARTSFESRIGELESVFTEAAEPVGAEKAGKHK